MLESQWTRERLKEESWGTCLSSRYVNGFLPQLLSGENTRAQVLCMPSEAEVVASGLGALNVMSFRFSYEENRVSGCLCAQFVPCVYMKQIETVTVGFLESKRREKVEKICIFSKLEKFLYLPLLTCSMEKTTKPILFFLFRLSFFRSF